MVDDLELSSQDPIEFDESTGALVARGSAELQFKENLLLADEIRYNVDNRSASATGDVLLVRPGFRLLSDQLAYTFEELAAESGPFRLGQAPLLLKGESLRTDSGGLTATNVTLYYGEPEYWSPSVTASKTVLGDDGAIVLRHATAWIGPVPVLYLPYVSMTGADSPVRLELNGGYTSKKGLYVETTALMKAGQIGWLGAGIAGYTNRGIMIGPAWDHEYRIDNWKIDGKLRTGWLSDAGSRGIDRWGDPIPRQRGFIDYDGRADWQESLSLTTSVNYWSDSDIYRDFRQRWFDEDQEPDTFFQALYRGTDYYVTFLARPQINTFYRTQERLPELRIDQVPREFLDTGIYYRNSASVAYLTDRAPYRESLNSTRVDLYSGIQRPFNPEPWMRFIPVAGVRLTHYDKTINQRGAFTRVMGEIGADMEVDLHRNWDVEIPRWKINGLRHRMTPFIQYRWLPGSQDGINRIPIIDEDPFMIYPPMLNLADSRASDFYARPQTFRFGLRNVLQTRDQTYGSRDLVEWNFFYDWYPEGTTNNRSDSDLFQELVINPTDWLKLDLWLRINPSQGTFQDFLPSIVIHDGEVWSARYAARFLRGHINQHLVEGRYRFNETWGAGARFRFDTNQNELTEQIYLVSQKIGNAWTVDYEIRSLRNDRRDEGFQFRASFHYLNF